MNKLAQRLDALEKRYFDTGVYVVCNPKLWVLDPSEETQHYRNGTQEDASALAEQLPHATVVYVTYDEVPGL